MQMRCVNTNWRQESRRESGEDGLKVWALGHEGQDFEGKGDGGGGITWFDSSNPEELKTAAFLRAASSPISPIRLGVGMRTNLRRVNVLLIVLVVEASLNTGGKNTFLNAT